MLLRITTVALVSGFLATAVSAQSPITDYDVEFWLVGGGSPVSSYNIGPGTVACNQPFIPLSGGITNATTLQWDDMANPGMYCRFDFVSALPSNPVLALPINLTTQYELRLRGNNVVGSSPWSSFSNDFTRDDVPLAPTGVEVR